jgi:hypothetical protein
MQALFSRQHANASAKVDILCGNQAMFAIYFCVEESGLNQAQQPDAQAAQALQPDVPR